MAICQREHLDGELTPSLVGRKQDRFTSGQNLRVDEAEFSFAQSRKCLGGASTGKNPKQPLRIRYAHEDAAVLAPMRAGGDVPVPERDCSAAFHGDLTHVAIGFESDPLSVRREEQS